MHTQRFYRSIILAVLLLVGHLLSLPLSAAPHSRALSRVAPASIDVPAGSVLLFVSHARGLQTYECRDGQWAFHAPRAVLFDPQSHQRTGIHYGGIDRGLTPGPWWQSVQDGSRIRAGHAISAPSPNPNSIPQLQLKVLERYGAGVFSQVSYIQRLNTVGGVSPTGACSGNEWRWVFYTADYYFYGNS